LINDEFAKSTSLELYDGNLRSGVNFCYEFNAISEYLTAQCTNITICTKHTIWSKAMDKVTTADARKNLAEIINQVAYGKEPIVFTRRGKELAALVSIEDLMLLQKLEDQVDIYDARKAKNEPGEDISWSDLRKELDL
jgi:antitoxin Phd